MPWFKVDDELHDSKKPRLAGAAAMGVWVLAGSWCMDQLTDGFVPETVPVRWAPTNWKKLTKALVDAGLWIEQTRDGEPGWRFHDWDKYQPSAAKVKKDRKEARERMAELRALREGECA